MLVEGTVECRAEERLLHIGLSRVGLLPALDERHLAPHLVSLLHPLVHLNLLLHERAAVRELLLPLLLLLHQLVLELEELRLGHLLGVLRVVGHEHKLLEVLLLCLERPLDGRELVVEPDALLLEPFHDLLVRLPDALGLVVLNHSLVKPVLEGADVACEGRVVVGQLRHLLVQVLQLVLHAVELALPEAALVADIVVAAAQLLHLLLQLGDL
mmetsp:Transcript_35768/g.87983  ORF Transcript_35768/g.87983 Transcript_35768/m.87983 type:complete len:213 (-) Transcript_35768:451-1089(-)